MFSNVVGQALRLPLKLDPIDWTLVLALVALHIALWTYYALAVFSKTAGPSADKPTDEEQAAVRAAVLGSKDICGSGQNRSLPFET